MLEKLKKPNAKISATQFEKITGQKCTKANIEKFKKGEFSTADKKVNSYQEGQEMAVDVTADVVSGVASFGIYTAAVAAAPFTGGASIAVGVAAAAGTGALLKSGIKAADTYSGGRKYTSDDFIKDSATGAVSGVLAPITGGFGGAVGKTVATKVGLQTVKTVGKEIAEDVVETGFKQSLKSSLLNPGAYKYVGDGISKKALAYSAEVLADGTVNGGIDNGFRTAINGGSLSDVAKAAGEGALYAPLVGLGMKGSGYVFSKGFGKNIKKQVAKTVGENVDTKRFKIQSTQVREELKARISNAQKLTNKIEDIHIQNGKFRAPSSKFAETDEAFRNIIIEHEDEILKLSRKSGDDFIQSAFEHCKKVMGLEDSPIQLEIINGSTFSGSEASASEGLIRINRNWMNGDKAELIGVIAHELNHMFQYKEMHINSLLENERLNFSEELKTWINQQDEFLTGHDQYYYDKARTYRDNFVDNYIDPNTNYYAYKNQPVEKESFRRGDIVRDEYNRLTKIDPLEREALQEIINKIVEKFPNITYDTVVGIRDAAVITMKKPEFSNYSVPQFVNYFINLY